jgi:hypothetical protein
MRTSPRSRTSSDASAPAPDVFTRVQGDWPIDTLSCESHGHVTVRLLGTDDAEMSGQHVTLQPSGGGWSIVRIGSWYH